MTDTKRAGWGPFQFTEWQFSNAVTWGVGFNLVGAVIFGFTPFLPMPGETKIIALGVAGVFVAVGACVAGFAGEKVTDLRDNSALSARRERAKLTDRVAALEKQLTLLTKAP